MYSMTSGDASVTPSVARSVVAAIAAGVVLLVIAMRKKSIPLLPILMDSNIRYDIDEYIGDDEL